MLGCEPARLARARPAARGPRCGRWLGRPRLTSTPDDVRAIAPDVLRHRVIIGYAGQADGVTPDDVVRAVLDNVATPTE